ncbi:MAG TPA: carbon-nitrogen hydrolase family protein [Pyrinomonadaceae bacterium]
MSTIKIALANLRYPSTPDESITIAEQAIADAARQQAQIVCFPECYVPGYRAHLKDVPAPTSEFLNEAWARIAKAAAAANIAVILGTERVVDEKPLITVLVINGDGTIAGFQDKVQLDPSEDDMYSRGEGRKIFEVAGAKFGIVICHEGWRYPETTRWAARHGAEIVFHPHYSWKEDDSYVPASFADPRNTFHETACLCRAAENTCYFATVNYAGDGSPTTSAVIKPDGTLLSFQSYGTEGLLIADIDLAKATRLLAKRYNPVDN